MAAAGFASEWESRAAAPRSLAPRQPKKGLDARPGRKSWERPADGFEQLRAPLERLPPAARRARVPDNGQVLSLPISEISSNMAYFYEEGARGDASVMGIWDRSPEFRTGYAIQFN